MKKKYKSRILILIRILKLSYHLFFLPIIFRVKINEQIQKRNIKKGIEAPSPNPRTRKFGEMIVEHNPRDQEAKNELDNLTVGHQPLP